MLKNITVICDGGAYSLKISSLLYLFFDKNGFFFYLLILKQKMVHQTYKVLQDIKMQGGDPYFPQDYRIQFIMPSKVNPAMSKIFPILMKGKNKEDPIIYTPYTGTVHRWA